MTLRYGSVCSGIEAASVAWHPLGWRAAWVAEIEAFPSAVLAHHYPDVPNLGDMTTLPAQVRLGLIEAPDVLVGGTPCQAFSVAGLRNSLADDRGNLTLSYFHLLDAIDHARAERNEPACIAVWENVPGVLSTKDNAFGCFLAGLAGETEPLLAPGGKWSDAGFIDGPSRAIAWRVLDAQYFGLAQRRRRVFVVASARDDIDPAAILFEFEGVRRDSPPSREARQETAGTLEARTGGGGSPGTDGACAGHVQPVAPPLMAKGNRTGGDRPPGTCVDTCGSLIPTWWDGGQVSQTLDAVLAKGQTMPEKNRFPAVLQPVALPATMPTLSSADSGSNRTPALLSAMQVRRLTPRECEKLQGFEPDYTLVPYRSKPAADGPRYKALGNSMAVPCMRWIGERIAASLV